MVQEGTTFETSCSAQSRGELHSHFMMARANALKSGAMSATQRQAGIFRLNLALVLVTRRQIMTEVPHTFFSRRRTSMDVHHETGRTAKIRRGEDRKVALTGAILGTMFSWPVKLNPAGSLVVIHLLKSWMHLNDSTAGQATMAVATSAQNMFMLLWLKSFCLQPWKAFS
jgi:hypothetical protein